MNIHERVPALVIGDDVSALNVIRSLGRRSIEVYAMGSNHLDYGAVSRYAKFLPCEDLTDEAKVIDGLQKISKNVGKRLVLFCTSDLHVLFVSRNREFLGQFFDFVMPDHEIIETLMDKKKFSNFANKYGFSVPKTFFLNTRENFERIASKISYPCVVKPIYRTAFWSKNVPAEKKVFIANSPLHLSQKLSDLKVLDQPLILQEWVPGDDQQVYFCLAYIDRQGQSLALFTGKKLRQYPSFTGVTSLAESIKDKRLADTTLEVLKVAGCLGLCSVEFKFDVSDNTLKITEPTVGRVDLQEGISINAGLDIPFIAYQDAIGISQSFQSDYKVGLKWINEPFEFNAFLVRKRTDGNQVVSFFREYRGKRSFALFAFDDPKPFIRFIIWVCKRATNYLKKVSRSFRREQKK